jgi:riboflavin synthase
MFTGIIETVGEITSKVEDKSNLILWVKSSFTHELKIDQSVAHNGVCLTVTEIKDDAYSVTLIDETVKRTSFLALEKGSSINLERCMPANGRFDGHIVQGHVDQTGTCKSVTDRDGSWVYQFEFDASTGNFTVEKGSITINGVSLTVVDSGDGSFSVAIIPYTFEHTNFNTLKKGDIVNLEFDILGKYLKKIYESLRK